MRLPCSSYLIWSGRFKIIRRWRVESESSLVRGYLMTIGEHLPK